MRAVFVLAGVELLQSFHAVLYVFGALLLLTGLRMFLPSKRVMRPDRNPLVLDGAADHSGDAISSRASASS